MDIQNRTISMENLVPLLLLQMKEGGRAKLTVTGHSMRPMLFHQRDSVELTAVSQRQKKGDVVLYRRENGQYVLHRIIAVTEKGYVCCGDNQYVREPVSHNQLLGVVDTFTRKGKVVSVAELGYRLYTAAWVELFSLRRCYIPVRRCVGRLCQKIKNDRGNTR